MTRRFEPSRIHWSLAFTAGARLATAGRAASRGPASVRIRSSTAEHPLLKRRYGGSSPPGSTVPSLHGGSRSSTASSCTVAKWQGTRLLSETSQVRSLPVQPMWSRKPASEARAGREATSMCVFFPAVGIHVFHTGEVARFPHVSSRLITSRDEAQWWGASFGTRRSLVRFQSSRPTGTRGSPRAPACPGRSSSVSRAAEYPRHPLCPAPGRPARVTVNQQDAGANPVCDSEIRTKEREQAPRERDRRPPERPVKKKRR